MKKILFIILLLTSSASVWAQNIVVYIAPKMAKCGGNLDVMCLQVKEESEKSYDHLVTNIDGFTFEEGYEYKLSVYRGYHENPPVTNPAVYYTLRKVLSKKLPNDTLKIANRPVDCKLDMINPCLLYKTGNANQWDTTYRRIKGFKYTAGYDYELLVSKKPIDNMGAIATYEYTLIKILSKKPTMVISSRNREALDGRKFTLIAYLDSGEYKTTVKSNKPVTLTFKLDENSAGGSDGCNQMGTRVEINNSAMTFGSIMATKMYCPDMDVDRILQLSLNKVNRYKLSGNILKLYEGKTLLLEYEAIMEDVLPEKKQ
jgi:heat shock protein HslJ